MTTGNLQSKVQSDKVIRARSARARLSAGHHSRR
jgi:hypothetical protein